MAIKRLYIEVDIDNDYNRAGIRSKMRRCRFVPTLSGQRYSELGNDDFFWKSVTDARFEPKLFEYISEADEIYMSTSITPIVGGTDMGSPELWHKMMTAAIDAGIIGKSIFNLNMYDRIHWDNLDPKLLDKAFRKNYLYVVSEDWDKWEQVDIDNLLRELKKKRR